MTLILKHVEDRNYNIYLNKKLICDAVKDDDLIYTDFINIDVTELFKISIDEFPSNHYDSSITQSAIIVESYMTHTGLIHGSKTDVR